MSRLKGSYFKQPYLIVQPSNNVLSAGNRARTSIYRCILNDTCVLVNLDKWKVCLRGIIVQLVLVFACMDFTGGVHIPNGCTYTLYPEATEP